MKQASLQVLIGEIWMCGLDDSALDEIQTDLSFLFSCLFSRLVLEFVRFI